MSMSMYRPIIDTAQEFYRIIANGYRFRKGNGNREREDERISRYIEAHISDLVEVTKYYGEFMIKMIGTGTLDYDKMWKAVDKLQRGVTTYRLKGKESK